MCFGTVLRCHYTIWFLKQNLLRMTAVNHMLDELDMEAITYQGDFIASSVVDTKTVWSVFGKHWLPPKLPPESPAGRSSLHSGSDIRLSPHNKIKHKPLSLSSYQFHGLGGPCCLSTKYLLSCDAIAFFNCCNMFFMRLQKIPSFSFLLLSSQTPTKEVRMITKWEMFD